MNIRPNSAAVATADESPSTLATERPPSRPWTVAGFIHQIPRAGERIPRLESAAVALLVAVHAVLAWVRRSPSFTTMNDDAFYVLLARSIRQLHYIESFIVGTPFHVQYPPGYPAFLAVLGSLFGERYGGFVVANIALSCGALLLGFLAARPRLGPGVALGALALSAINPLIVEMAGVVRSESLLLCLWAAALWALPRSAHSRGWTAFVIACAACAALTRTAGLPMGVAIAVLWFWQRRWYASAALAVAGALTIGAWLAWAAMAPQPAVIGASYLADVSAAQQRAGGGLLVIRAIGEHIGRYVVSDVPFALSVPTIPNTPLDNVAWVLILLGLAVAGMIRLWTRWPIAILVSVLYGAILAVWPYDAPRFVVPILPLLYAICLAGAVLLASRFRRTRWVLSGIAAIAAVATLVHTFRDAARATQCDRAAPRTSTTCFSAEQVAFVEALQYVRDSTPPGLPVLAAKEATVAQTTGHQVLRVSGITRLSPGALLATMRRDHVSRVVLGSLEVRDRQLTRALRPICDQLTVERRYTGETYVFELSADGTAVGGRAACDALTLRLAQPSGGAPIGLW